MATSYGFQDLQHLYNTRVNQVGVQRVYTAVQDSVAEHTRVINEMMASLVERTTVAKEQIELPGGGTLQPIDENGVPLPVKPSGSYDVAYPIYGGATAWGTNRVSRALMTVQEADRNTMDAMMRDADWLRRHMLAALFDNTTTAFVDKAGLGGSKGLGSITIQPLANGDSVTYVRRGGSSSTDDHYLAQAGAIADNANPFPTIYDELAEHPSNRVDGNNPVIVYIATSLKATTRALTNFVERPEAGIQRGISADQLTMSAPRGFGDEFLGWVDNCWIVEWSALPAGYMIAHATGAGAVLKMREYEASELQGFFTEQHSLNGNHLQVSMLRYCGFGVANRVGAVVYYVGSGSYAIPSGYTCPLPA